MVTVVETVLFNAVPMTETLLKRNTDPPRIIIEPICFLDDIDRIHDRNYLPSNQDILYTRVATIGVSEVTFTVKKSLFRVFDVGGQKSERRKWIHCFDDVQAIIFIVAISEYNQTLREDNDVNRMADSMSLFNDVINNEWFLKTSTILFLNKIDLFKEKIKMVSIKIFFQDYTGLQTYADSVDHIRQQFKTIIQNKKKKLHIHETCATDTNQVQKVLDSVTDFVISENQRGTGIT